MSKYTRFESVVNIEVVDRTGRKTGEERIINNAPMSALFPDEPVVLINWLYDAAPKPTVDDLTKAITVDGKEFHGGWAFGSSAKHGYSIGLTRDLLPMLGGKFGEDGQRCQRALLANGTNGAAHGEFRVKFVKSGTIVPGAGLVADGFGYMSRKMADAVDNGANKIELGSARDSFHFWQRIPWTAEVEAECKPIIESSLIDLAEGGFNFRINSAMEERKRFIDIEPGMITHPWIANAMARSSAEYAARTAMTVKTDSRVYVAVPSIVPTIMLSGKNTVTRYPIDAWGSIKATNVDADLSTEPDRIARMEVVQYSLTSAKNDAALFCKGCVGIVEDLGEFDLILCDDDRKMCSHKNAEVTVNGVFVATQWFAAGNALGINPAFWKEQGGDFDGDTVIVGSCAERPALWNEVSKFPEQKTLKLTKTHTLLTERDTRSEMIVKSMSNIVGMATNLMAASFVYANREVVAKRMGYTLETLDSRLNFWIKVGTDLFKTNLDADEIEKQLHQFQSNYCKVIGKLPPWCNWPNEWAFRHGVPSFYTRDMGMDKDDPVVRNSVPPAYDGTISQILRLALDNVKCIVETPIESRPLKEFDIWAPEVGEEVQKHANNIQVRFNVRSNATNWEWDEAVANFKGWLLAEIDTWMKTDGLDRATAACAMWHAAHNVRSTYAGAASVFMAFQEECFEIVSKKPGLDKDRIVNAVVLTGDVLKQDSLGIVDAKVVEFCEIKSGRKIVRKKLEVLRFEFNFAPDQPVPAAGKCKVMLKRRSQKSFFCYTFPA